MEEIRAVEPNGYRLISTFSGCGGSCLGFRMAGFETIWASEFIEAARKVYEQNYPGVRINPRDIRALSPEELLVEAGVEAGEIDVLEGSPPCASFSMAGSRERGWGKEKDYSETRQRDDDLFFEFARILRGVQPRVFIAENVAGLVRGKAKGMFKAILSELRAAGYVVEAKLLDAQWLGVPQHRERLIFMGVREDLGLSPAYPEPFSYRYSIRDALPHLARVTGRTGSSWERTESPVGKPMNTVLQGDPKTTRYEVEERTETSEEEDGGRRQSARVVGGPGSLFHQKGKRFPITEPHPTISAQVPHQFYVEGDGPSLDGYALGKEYDKLRPGEQSEKYFQLVRPHVEKPCPTVTQTGGKSPGTACVVHPTEKRKFTIAELRRICGFPDDFVLTGTYPQQWERLGRAVPPPMAYAVAVKIRDEILRRADEQA
jgi:DNA (cytosine-5)-methyltransferase 1